MPRGLDPNTEGESPVRRFRAGADYDRAKAVADRRGENLSALFRLWLKEYADEGERELSAAVPVAVCGLINPRRKTMRDNACVRADPHNGRHCDAAGFEWKGAGRG